MALLPFRNDPRVFLRRHFRPGLFAGLMQLLLGRDTHSRIRGKTTHQRFVMLRRHKIHFDTIVDHPLERKPSRLYAKPITYLFGDDDLALWSYNVQHATIP